MSISTIRFYSRNVEATHWFWQPFLPNKHLCIIIRNTPELRICCLYFHFNSFNLKETFENSNSWVASNWLEGLNIFNCSKLFYTLSKRRAPSVCQIYRGNGLSGAAQYIFLQTHSHWYVIGFSFVCRFIQMKTNKAIIWN